MSRVTYGSNFCCEPTPRSFFGGPILVRVLACTLRNHLVGGAGDLEDVRSMKAGYWLGNVGRYGWIHRDVAQVLARVHGGRRTVQS